MEGEECRETLPLDELPEFDAIEDVGYAEELLQVLLEAPVA